jgi:hypothetical protein
MHIRVFLILAAALLAGAAHATPVTLAPGVTHDTVLRGAAQPAVWTLTVGVARDPDNLINQLNCFDRIRQAALVTTFDIPGAPETEYRVVSGGAYPSRAAAMAAAAPAGCKLVPRNTREDAANSQGPWRIDIVAVAPGQAQGRWSVLAGLGRARTSDLARASHALVAINGGFFVEQDADGYPGQPAGVSVIDGRVNSAPVAGRPAVLFPRAVPPRIVANVDWQPVLRWSDGATTAIDGINRPQGRVRNCGRAAGNQPIHDRTCSYTADMVYYPAGSRLISQVKQGARFALAPSGAVRELAADAAPGPADALLAGGADALRQQIAQGATAQFVLDTGAADGSLVNAGPTLLLKGKPVRMDAQQGWAIDATADPAHQLLMHDWINRRSPRTAFGVRADGTVLLVTVDGRQADSVGMTIDELRGLMASLGAVDAVNLDGGGSTAMAIRGKLVNHPSDAAGERKVGDVIVYIHESSKTGAMNESAIEQDL